MAATTESAELCTAAIVGSSAAQTEAIATVGAAAALAGEKSVSSNEMAAISARTAAVAQQELAAANVLAGNEAVIAGGKTVGAMATARVATAGMLESVLALAGGWLGVAIALGYAIYKLDEYHSKQAEQGSNTGW